MKQIVYLIFTISTCITIVNGQSKNAGYSFRIHELKVGDSVPDFAFHFINRAGSSSSFKDFRGKPVLLDFWATWCGPCIASMPKMHELQSAFGDKLQIILLNDSEKKRLVEKFISNRSNIPTSRITLPVSLADSIVTKVLFKHTGIPVIYWIDSNGILRYKTYKVNVNEKNISAFLNDKPIVYADTSGFTFKQIETLNKDCIWRSELRHSGAGSAFSNFLLTASGTSVVISRNSSILDLLRFTYGFIHEEPSRESSWIESWPISRVLVETEFSNNLGRHHSNDKQADSLYNYDLRAPDFSSPEKILSSMKSDLNKWFGYSAKVEKRLVKCLSLTIPDTLRMEKPQGKLDYKITDTEFRLNNISIRSFMRNNDANISVERNFLPRYPLVDDTGFSGKLGKIEIDNINTRDEKALAAALGKYGIRLTLVEKEIDMLVVRKSNSFQ